MSGVIAGGQGGGVDAAALERLGDAGTAQARVAVIAGCGSKHDKGGALDAFEPAVRFGLGGAVRLRLVAGSGKRRASGRGERAVARARRGCARASSVTRTSSRLCRLLAARGKLRAGCDAWCSPSCRTRSCARAGAITTARGPRLSSRDLA